MNDLVIYHNPVQVFIKDDRKCVFDFYGFWQLKTNFNSMNLS